jgi:hypothetical protein
LTGTRRLWRHHRRSDSALVCSYSCLTYSAGTWPFSYSSCDVGILPNQTQNGAPAAAVTGAPGGGPLSYQPGQRLPSCTCSGGDHPGPNDQTGRGVPEIDILEAQVDVNVFQGQVSQSFQIAPYNYQYQFDTNSPATVIQNSQTQLNTYTGGIYQQAVSAVTYISSENYNGQAFAKYGYEWWSNPNNRPEGYIQWYSEGQPTWKVTSASIGADSTVDISARLIPEEPMVSCLLYDLSQCLTPFIVHYPEPGSCS